MPNRKNRRFDQSVRFCFYQFLCDLPGVEPLIGEFHFGLNKMEDILYKNMVSPDLHTNSSNEAITLTPFQNWLPSSRLEKASFVSDPMHKFTVTDALNSCLRLLADSIIRMRPYEIYLLCCLKQLSAAKPAMTPNLCC